MFGIKHEADAIADRIDGNLSALHAQLISRLQGHIDKAIAEGLAKIQKDVNARLAGHWEILRSHADALNKHGDRLQLVLLEDGREFVDVPAHMEIRKVSKGR